MAIYLCIRSLNVRVDMSILSDVSRVIAPAAGNLRCIPRCRSDQPGRDAISMDVARGNAVVLARDRIAGDCASDPALEHGEGTQDSAILYWTCAVIVMGFMTNRLNVSITGLQASSAMYLHTEVDRVRRLAGDDHCRHGGFSLRRNLFGHSAQELAAAAGRSFPCSRACVSGRVSAKPRVKQPGVFRLAWKQSVSPVQR
jgi:hypothetical protein